MITPALILLLFSWWGWSPEPLPSAAKPEDAFFLQRMYPDSVFQWRAYLRGLQQAAGSRGLKTGFSGFSTPWQLRGPLNAGGRINTVAVHPQDERIMLAGLARGGIFRTTDGGQNWTPVFDDQLFLSIGALAFAPSDPNVVYAGTGDPNVSAYPGIGDGVYRSDDGGQTWKRLSCCGTGIVAKVVIHPRDPDRVYVASMGLPFQSDEQRGVYESTNGGRTWQKSLFVSAQAGVIDLVIDPQNPEILYAASWDRIRNNRQSITSGPGGRIFKSTDGGTSWRHLTAGLPVGDQGRIGLAIAPSRPSIIYAVYIGPSEELLNVFRTEDSGNSWQPLLEPGTPRGLSLQIMDGFGWYFGKIRVNPKDENDVFVLAVDLWRSRDGGQTWNKGAPSWWEGVVHSDKHDLQFTPGGSMLLATDGGLYLSGDDGASWQDAERLPATQFYRVAVNPHQPDWYYGGTQDNGTLAGARDSADWLRLYGADGFQPAFDSEDPSVLYVETQFGGIKVSSDNGLTWMDATGGIIRTESRNWDTPYLLSSHRRYVFYTGTFRVYKSDNGLLLPSWLPISDDLTKGNRYGSLFHNISVLAESPLQPGLLYAGTSDGNVWQTPDDGSTWRLISTALPDRYVTAITPSPTKAARVYVAHSGYRDNDFIPRIHRSEDGGDTWVDISANLPELAVNDIVVIPGHQDSIIFVATDGGVYGTLDGGHRWGRLGSNMPLIPVFDITYYQDRNELVAGTFARSVWTFSLAELESGGLVSTSAPMAKQSSPVQVFPQPAGDWIRIKTSIPDGEKEWSWRVFDLNGRKVLEGILPGQGSNEGIRMDVSGLEKGGYILHLRNGRHSASAFFLKM